jgi:phosphoserine phosphatase
MDSERTMRTAILFDIDGTLLYARGVGRARSAAPSSPPTAYLTPYVAG